MHILYKLQYVNFPIQIDNYSFKIFNTSVDAPDEIIAKQHKD